MSDTIKIAGCVYHYRAPRKQSGGRWIGNHRVSNEELRCGRGLIRKELSTREARAALTLLVNYALELDRMLDRREEEDRELPGVGAEWREPREGDEETEPYPGGWMIRVKTSGRSSHHYYGPFPSLADALDVAAFVSRKLGL